MGFTLLSVLMFLSTWFVCVSGTAPFTAYTNDFIDPDYILVGNFGDQTQAAQASIMAWANELSLTGPWSVIQKPVTPPSGDKHDYMSWAPYWWPDCSSVGNTTVLPDEESIWTTCPYVQHDGVFNPDRLLVNDIGRFSNMSEAVLYNTIAWTFRTSDRETYEANAVKYLRTWFIDTETRMNTNLAYGQMHRGPTGQKGTATGVLDLHSMTKVASSVLILRQGQSTAWTAELDDALKSWCREYAQWLQTAAIAVSEGNAENNHGTFYAAQLAAVKIILGDLNGAKNATDNYFKKQFLEQIDGKGEQPLEASRTHPYHYRSYNLAAVITTARIASYLDRSSHPFNLTTNGGATIKTAVDYSMTISPATSSEEEYTSEIYPNVAAVAAIYGDSDGSYLNFVKDGYPDFIEEPFILWDQPWAQDEKSM
ncbi:chondroitin AC/alginate lyase [Crepidotus variabilis]|uniref:Chondroitin AC/alginate lyase n=1 Tax=Crepidotus variabilis TaxID=179855 RepID=A0A9P6EM40_9AGAR|nr:chondroitin AC/alginate lyase [Crepidotus variabilis]